MNRILLAVILVFGFAVAAFGQGGGMGSIEGRITDPSGSVVPAVTVRATNSATQVVYTAISNEVGNYAVLRLPPGTYTVTVEHSGFKKLERANLLVQVGDRLPIDLTLQVGASTEVVNVTSEAPLVRAEDAQTGEVINNKMIEDLPQLNRDPFALIRLSGNVQGDGDRAVAGNTLRINGGRTQGIDYFVDGVTVGTGMAHAVSYNTPTTEDVAEFRVITNGISAEYGRLSGGAVEVVTKSGTNAPHGQVFEYLENRVFNANTWLNNRNGVPKGNFQQNTYGGAFGGPVYIPKVYNGKDKTFFFFNYEGFRYNQGGAVQLGSVPTDAMKNGDFTNVCLRGTCALLFDQNGVVTKDAQGVYQRQTPLNDGYHVSPTQFDPVAKAALQFLPEPNHAPDAGTTWQNNYLGLSNHTTDRYDWSTRIDENLTANQRLFARFSTHYFDDKPNSRWFGPGQPVSENYNKGMFQTTLNYDWTMSPTLVLSARVGGNFTPYSSGSTVDPKVTSSIPYDPEFKALVGNTASIQLWAPNMTPIVDTAALGSSNATTYNANIALVKTLNKHMIKMGYEHRRYYDNVTNGAYAYELATGRTVKRGAFDSGWNDEDYVDSFAGFLQGYISHSAASGYTSRANNFNYHGAYVQDDFRVSPKLTLGLGVRWEMETPVTDRFDKIYFWDPNAPSPFTMKPGYDWNAAVVAGLKSAGLDPSLASQVPTPDWVKNGFGKGAVGLVNTSQYKNRYATGYNPLQFEPRISAAYSIDSKNVLRGSVGGLRISRSGDIGALTTGGAGMALTDSVAERWHVNDPSVPYYKMINTLSHPYQPGDINHYTRDIYAANEQVTGGDPTLIAYPTTSHMPQEWAWNLTYQRQLSANFVAEAGYNGNKGIDLLGTSLFSHFPASQFVPSNLNIYSNVMIANPVSQVIKYPDPEWLARAIYPYPYFGPAVLQGANVGRSLYNGMNLRFERRMANGVAFLLNYTLSRGMDNVGGPNSSNGGIVDTVSTGGHAAQSVESVAPYGISPIDQTHRLTAYYAAQLPFGKNRRWLSATSGVGGKLLNYVVGGWEFNGITTFVSGVPINIPGSNGNNVPSRMEYTYSMYTSSDHDLGSSSYNGVSSVVYDSGQTNPNTLTVRRLDPTKLINLDGNPALPGVSMPKFQLGDINPIYGGIRQPHRITTDMSFMKSFPIFGEGRYV
jgi:Carboxypeptidase regulatory-like domain